ncbi:uncharacterized protein LOC128335877 [Hemicordylus capensis]|uniref:uncharacterized protein LOC128335877 n=1 Tax=Hemicordylus capensis TaxID=884348 RepID=UPI0023044431|nr:uncharacterized protein LOC128335877 [Hemicordylus capensis]
MGTVLLHMWEFWKISFFHFREAGEQFSESQKLEALFLSMPPSYSSIISQLETHTNLSFEEVVQTLSSEANRRKVLNSRYESELASNFALKATIGHSRGNPRWGGNAARGNHMGPSHLHTKRSGFVAAKETQSRERGHMTASRETAPEMRPTGTNAFRCFLCNQFGHKVANCPKNQTRRTDFTKENVNQDFKHTERYSNRTFNVNLMQSDEEFIFYSGSSVHISNNLGFYTELFDIPEETVYLGNNTTIKAKKKGGGILYCKLLDGSVKPFFLKNVLYIPDFSSSLISISKLEQQGCELYIKNRQCVVTQNGEVCLVGCKSKGLYSVEEQSTDRERPAQSKPEAYQPNEVNLAKSCLHENCL